MTVLSIAVTPLNELHVNASALKKKKKTCLWTEDKILFNLVNASWMMG